MIENTDPCPLHPNPLIAATMAVDAVDAEFVEVLESPCEEMIFDLAAQIRLLEDEISIRQARQLDRIEQ